MKQIDIIPSKDSPLIVSVPHGSGEIPSEIRNQLRLPLKKGPHDTGTRELALAAAREHATLVLAGFSRIAVDVNRYPAPSDVDLQPIKDLNTSRQLDSDRLVRHHMGTRKLWKQNPDKEELKRRVREYHAPYHQALSREITRLRETGRPVLLIDLHSMSEDAYDFILGDNGGRSAGRSLCLMIQRLLSETLSIDDSRIGYVGPEVWDAEQRNRLSPSLLQHTGGFITLNYGNPKEKVYAIQIEISRFLFSNTKTATLRKKALQQIAEQMKTFFEQLRKAV